ncbi:Nuclear hormone receptor family member nhr-11 [Caenorhabditis elegans]|uniref:Nuclear hormone receptor family member nhr-11 n=1 Tax=Caenorhabditis elegans TaxID=6239 RepID=H9G2T1_CAEEL|nr:Nuclear hormone receptor family member nhr-11 [Caenorhabditis elegans]CCG28238.1 Nuclear hormone receptor family member nhr-11 [Caenorhabditis elegans]|eukprot:NP_001255359.1 Nuclear hormone receptor family member nhr-11 [Caenorhabditis elegans]
MGPLCAVCESPTAFTLHFGGRCCKACAAFFRRTIALDLKYECAADDPCEIHFSMRLVCRECRLRKCYSAGMRSELVRSKRENFACTRRKDSRNNSDAAPNSNSPSTRQSSSPEEMDDWSFQMFEEKPKIEDLPLTPSISHPPLPTQLMPEESSRTSSFDGGYCSSYPSSSAATHPSPPGMLYSIENNSILQYYHSMETGLCSKRRIMYTNTGMDFILDTHANLQCPFTVNDLRPHDYRNFRGMLRHDFVMLFDYATRFPEFNSFTSHEKNMFYRQIVAVDFILSSAYYTAKLGQAHRQMVLTNGEYLNMDPLPMSGNEIDARRYFDCDEDFSKYRALMPMHIAIWEESIVPFSKLNVTFEEFCLLKALTVWQATYFKLTENGREKCRRQRNIIIGFLSKMCHSPGGGGEHRVGELLMSMNYLRESAQKLTTSYVMLTVFNVLNCDSMLHEMLNFQY